MAATVEIVETNGAVPAYTTITALPLGSVDQANLDIAAHPIVAGQCSFEKWLRLKVSSLGTTSILDNVRIYLQVLGGGWLTSESMKINGTSNFALYAAASYPGGGPVNSVSTVATRAMPEAALDQANLGLGGALSGEINSGSTLPFYSDYFVLQLQTGVDTPSGDVQPKVLVVMWDER